MQEVVTENLTDKKTLKINVIWNFIGQGLPLIVALFTIPLLIKGLGTTRYGILTLIWMMIGYTSLFDMGLGRALTQLISKKLGENDFNEIPALIWTSLILISVIGIAGGFIFALLVPFVIKSFIKIPQDLTNETLYSLYLVAFCIPVLTLNSCIRGVLESYQKFDVANFIRIILGLTNFAGPLLVLFFTKNLIWSVLIIVLGRILAIFAYFVACTRVVDKLTESFSFERKYIKPLISFGGYLTVSNILGPIMDCSDRFLISSLLSVSVVAYYSTPNDVVMRLATIPTAIAGVMFPAFSTEIMRDKKRVERLYYSALKYIFLILLPFVLAIIFFAKLGLSLWISPEFAEHSYRLAQIFAVGILVHSFGHVSFSLVQALGRADISALLNLIELPLYLLFLFIFIKNYGLIGASIAWALRVSINSAVLQIIVAKLIKNSLILNKG